MSAFEFTEEQQAAQRALRAWCERELSPHVRALEKGELLPYELCRNLWSTFGPAEILDPAMFTIVAIELSRVCPGFMMALGASVGLAGATVMRRGSPAQRERWGIPLVTLQGIGAWGMTEPGGGSDAFGGMRTVARRSDDGGYRISGSKTFITNAPYADVLVIYAKIVDDPGDDPRGRPIHGFILDRGMAGLSVGPPMEKMGMHSSPTGDIFLDDVEVGRDRLLGEVERPHARSEARDVFQGERHGLVPMCLGIVERCLDESLRYARQRVAWGQPIGEFQLIQDKLARMYVHRENIRNLLFKHLAEVRAGVPGDRAGASVAKLYSARAATEVAMDAVQILGGNGYMREYQVEMLARDAKLLQIGGGTDEVQIATIARELLSR